MKQLIQDLASGEVDFIDVPTADPPAGMIQIELRSSVISSGTERSLLEFGQASLLGALRPERRHVLALVTLWQRHDALGGTRGLRRDGARAWRAARRSVRRDRVVRQPRGDGRGRAIAWKAQCIATG